MIDDFCDKIEAFKSVEMPVDKPFDMMNVLDYGKMMLKMAPAMKYLSKVNKITIKEYAEQFKSPILKNALSVMIPEHYSATALISTIASMEVGIVDGQKVAHYLLQSEWKRNINRWMAISFISLK